MRVGGVVLVMLKGTAMSKTSYVNVNTTYDWN
jgi:hypothetical protein